MIPEGNVAELQKAVDADVQAACNKYIEAYKPSYVFALIELSGIRPEFSEKSVQRGYEECIEHGWADSKTFLYQLRNLKKLTGICPAEETLQKEYNWLANRGDVDEIMVLKKFSGITPDLDWETVQNCYKSCLMKSRFNKFRKIEKLTGIKPDKQYLKIVDVEDYLSPKHAKELANAIRKRLRELK